MSNFTEELQKIKAFVLDIDGVLSRQTISLDSNANPLRTINLRDGYALQLAARKGYSLCVISGNSSTAIHKRLASLGVKHIYLGIAEKAAVMKEYMEEEGLTKEQVMYMGDDIPDFRVMKMAGVAVCPSDADNEIKQISVYISDKKGGEGCVRDVIEQVMRLHGKWMNNDAFSW